MSQISELVTARLCLREWRSDDLPALAALNADQRVMEYFPKLLDRPESDQLAVRIAEHFERHGFGLWAVEVPGIEDFIGFVGLNEPTFTTHFTPCVEIGWRLAARYWGHGYATEAARAVFEHAFETLQLKEIVSFTVPANRRSWKVMERLGMTRNPAEDFDHPNLAEGHPLRRHVLYRASRTSWKNSQQVP